MRLNAHDERERSGASDGISGGSLVPLLRAVRFPLVLLAIGLLLTFVGPLPMLGVLIMCGSAMGLAFAVVMPWLGG